MKKNRNDRMLLSVLGVVFVLLILRLGALEREENRKENEAVFQNLDKNGENGDERGQEVLAGEETYRLLYPDLYVEEKVAYLTFDDGPSAITEEILSILAEEQIKATFFVLGSTMTEEGKETLRRMSQEGHTIGLHTYSHHHQDIYGSVEQFLDDFHKVYELVVTVTGETPTLFRFPWGSRNPYAAPIKEELSAEMERRGFTYFDWNVSGEDSVGKPSTSSIYENVRKDFGKYTEPVILLHDGAGNGKTAQVLPEVIRMLREAGYRFDTLDHREKCQFP